MLGNYLKFNAWDYNNEKLKKAVLYVYYVESMEIDDPEKIERYSFNTIKYDKKTGQLRIINEPNMDIKLVVSKFAMKLEADNSLKIPTVDFPWWF
ncbi:MAG: hypothetical protein M1269_10480 [Chloroflexi bacterium]|nr:hypothetical protein [Chloroflexota bacterium]